ncbi:outer membrane protein assembly factor BamE [Allorhizobium sp. BGMRC 0089]|uniref:outer membrane protein assembly factor BamE n=1 Tax=Allorhizobium sonneratiae TaxID=2934936 RepID=UPI002033E739|nr:outer membrane protein assembly factor BamE [Allorhizobium sonneratiae]MCM2292125.1 outer membrane protein assembly factor BamE [Allorhizobium sonneratiae]
MGDTSLKTGHFRRKTGFAGAVAVALLAATAGLSGCTTGEVFHNGYIVDPQALALVPVGASREQVLLSLGTPSTTATFDGEVFYYISQTRKRPFAFMKQQIVDQHVLAIYFGKDGTVVRRANYTLKDGKVFDMVSRTTPTGGKDMTFLQQVLSGGGGAANSIKSMLQNSNGGGGM